VMLTVLNRDRRDHVYTLSTHRPSQVGNRRVPPGYSDIPDPSWLWFERTEVSVPGGGSAEVRMYLQVPADDRYHNQHWSVSIGVVGKPGPGETLALAVYPRFEIETASASRREVRHWPAGEIGLAPSVVRLLRIAPGQRGECEFVIANNSLRAHRYEITVLPRGEVEGKHIFASPGHAWMPDAHSVRPGVEHVWVGKRRTAAVPVRVEVPADVTTAGAGWESIIFVRRDDGTAGFVRVLAEPGEGSAQGGGT